MKNKKDFIIILIIGFIFTACSNKHYYYYEKSYSIKGLRDSGKVISNGKDFTEFIDQLYKTLEYPKNLQKLKMEGTTKILLIINKNGELIEIKIYKSSGKKEFDNEALRAVEIASKKLPIFKKEVKLIFDVNFRTRLDALSFFR
ncbi:energy transducer TonB [Halarcobacter sp.]|uniref:energy transducer TonB n=1 Tax=Halarcobacter sp. TaxID=2321133 RepID=UPI002AA72130|nr:energy transducer TonB [Halarcobacter sp.]